MVKVNPGASYENIGSTGVPHAVYQISRSLASWFQRRFLKFFTIYGHGHVTWNIKFWTNFHSPHPMEAPYENWLQSAERLLSKWSLKMLNLSDLGRRSVNTLTFDINTTFCSREEDFFKIFTMAAFLVMWHKPFVYRTHFHSPSHGGSAWNLASIA